MIPYRDGSDFPPTGKIISGLAANGDLSFEWEGGSVIALTGELLEQIKPGVITDATGELKEKGTEFSFGPFRLQTIGYDFMCDWLVAERIEEQ